VSDFTKELARLGKQRKRLAKASQDNLFDIYTVISQHPDLEGVAEREVADLAGIDRQYVRMSAGRSTTMRVPDWLTARLGR
jgi:hypothetical protein